MWDFYFSFVFFVIIFIIFGIPLALSLTAIYYQNINKPRSNKTYRQRPKIKYNKTTDCDADDYVIVNIETTGLDNYKDKIIEICAIKYIGGAENSRFQSYVNPHCRIPKYITEMNNIYNTDVNHAPELIGVLNDFLGFIKDYTLIAYNSDFDMAFLQYNAYTLLNKTIENEVIDALPIAKRNLENIRSYKLSSIKSYFALRFSEHRAFDNCMVTNHLYQYCLEKDRRRFRYGIQLLNEDEELSENEIEYTKVIADIAKSKEWQKEDLKMVKNKKYLTIFSEPSGIDVKLKLYGRLKYVLIKASLSSIDDDTVKTSFGDDQENGSGYVRLFLKEAQQLWKFTDHIAPNRPENYQYDD